VFLLKNRGQNLLSLDYLGHSFLYFFSGEPISGGSAMVTPAFCYPLLLSNA